MRSTDLKFSWQTTALMTIVVMCALPLLLLVTLSVIPLNPLDVKSITITSKTVVAGEPVHYIVCFDKKVNKVARVLRQLNNERVTYYTPFESNMPCGKHCRSNFVGTSAGDMPGKYRLQETFIYPYFFFRDVVVVAQSDEFEILPRNGIPGPRGPKGDKGDKGGVSIFNK